MRTTFVVGRVTRKGAEMVMVDRGGRCPIPGPWTLKALVRAAPPATPGTNGAYPGVR